MNEVNELSLKRLLENAHIGIVIHRWDTSIVYANPTALRLLRLTYDQIIGKDAYDPQWSFLDDSGKKLLINDYPVNKVRKSKQRLLNEVMGVIDSSREDVSWFLINAYYEGDEEGDDGFIVVTFNDISDTKKLFSFQDIVENTQDIVIVTEADNIDYPTDPKIIYVNKAFENLTGYKSEEVIGETPRLLQGHLTDKEATARIRTALMKHQAINETLLNYDHNGRPYWINMSIIPLKNKYGDITHFAAIERDVSEQRFRQEQLENRNNDLKVLKKELENLVQKRTVELQKAKTQLEVMAYYDPLTNLPNRRHFFDQARKIVKYSNRQGFLVAVGMIDIDNFKRLNDTFGHDFGDVVLVKFANFLNQFFRSEDAFCRLGGEEFAFAVSVAKKDNAENLANRIMEGIKIIQVETDTGDVITITVSMGLKVATPDNNTVLENELKQADRAMYKIKSSGRNGFHIV